MQQYASVYTDVPCSQSPLALPLLLLLLFLLLVLC